MPHVCVISQIFERRQAMPLLGKWEGALGPPCPPVSEAAVTLPSVKIKRESGDVHT